MKTFLVGMPLALAAVLLLNGCVVAMGNKGGANTNGTLGQELMDLKKAKESGALTEAEFDEQRAKLLGKSPSKEKP